VSCYVPRYLEFGPRQADGWPTFVTNVGKEYCVEQVKQYFEALGYRPTATLNNIREAIFGSPYRPTELRGIALLDAQYAVAHRAALAADLTQVWTSRK
jgi:hypothetical protein